ncbi:MAG: DUF975 family protein [Planctomycetota bacterium]
MPIEFRCTQCNRLLRTQDETAGKKAKCPECGTILPIPVPGHPPQSQGATGVSPVPGELGQHTRETSPPPDASADSPFGPIPPPPTGPASPFAPGGPAQSENPYASPADYTLGAPAGYARAAAGRVVPSEIELGDVFSRTWELFKQQWGMALVLLLVAFLINMGVSIVCGFIPIIGGIMSGVFSVWINIGVALGMLKLVRGQEAEVGDIFTGGPYLVRVFLGSLLVGLMVLGTFGILFGPTLAALLFALQGSDLAVIISAGVLLGLVCSIPATIVSLMFGQFFYLILDRDAEIIESLSLSKQVMAGNKLIVFAIHLLLFLGSVLLIILTCGLGILVVPFVVPPFAALLNAIIYLGVTGQPTADRRYQWQGDTPFAGDAGQSPFTPPAGNSV